MANKIPTVKIGASNTFGFKLRLPITSFSEVLVSVVNIGDETQTIAKFAKAASTGVRPLRVDSVDPSIVWCDIDSTSTAKGYEATYKAVVTTERADASFESGKATAIVELDVLKLIK